MRQNPPPGTIPKPPVIPPDLRSPTPEDPDKSPSPAEVMTSEYITAQLKREMNRKRPRSQSSSFHDYDGITSSAHQHKPPSSKLHSSSRNLSSHGSPARSSSQSAFDNAPPRKKRSAKAHPRETQRSLSPESPKPSPVPRGYDSPDSDAEPEVIEESVTKCVSLKLGEDSEWVEFFQSKAKPPRVEEVLKQYKFVQRMIDTWEGKRAPFRTAHQIVDRVS